MVDTAIGAVPDPRGRPDTLQLDDGSPVHDFSTLLRSLATICRTRVAPPRPQAKSAFAVSTEATELQALALALIAVNLSVA